MTRAAGRKLFRSVGQGHAIDRETFEAREPQVREALLSAQLELQGADFSVLIVIAGVEGAGKGETVNLLLNWLDARGIETHALGDPSEEEVERPEYFRFWRRLPARGRIGIFFGSWYTRPIRDHSLGALSDDALDASLRRVVDFEQMLADEGVLLIKLWMHITKNEQKRRFKKLAENPETAWRVTRQDWLFHRTYDELLVSAGRTIRQTSTEHAPWHLVDASDARYRHLTVAGTILAAMEERLVRMAAPRTRGAPVTAGPPANRIAALNLAQSVAAPAYRAELQQHQQTIGRLARDLSKHRRAAVIVFEGSDAAGKGGCIRRLTQALDARFYNVVPIAAPTDEEGARPYLWRFWRHLPRRGHITIYDRSWYGRVLVENVEGLCAPDDVERAYGEINAFEEQLVEAGVIVVKFWLAISKDEQLRRFREREAMGFKRYKITDEDWRNRERWDSYLAAAGEMVERTSSDRAPWVLVEAEDKFHARLKVLRTIQESLAAAVGAV